MMSSRSIFALGVLALLALSAPASAEYRRWVDKNGVVNYSNFQPVVSSGPAADRELMVNEILVLSGLKRQLANIPSVIESQVRERGAQADQSELKRVTEIVKRSFQVDALQTALREALRSEFDADQLATLLLWYRSPIAHDLSDAEINASSPERAQKMRSFALQLNELPPTPGRLQAIERLDAATRGTELAADIAVTVGGATATALQDPSVTPRAFETIMKQKRDQLYQMIKAATIVGLLFTYQSVSEAKLHQYLEFLESGLGRRFTRVVHNSILNAVTASTKKISGGNVSAGRSAPPPLSSADGAPPREEEKALTVSLSGAGWTLDIPAKGFHVEKDQISHDERSRYLSAGSKAASVELSVRLEKGPPRSSGECRDYYWDNLRKRSPLKITDVKMSERGRMALVEYVVKEYQGIQINQKHLNAYLGRNDTCVDIHVSKIQFRPGEESLLNSIVDGARVRENAPVATVAVRGVSSVRSYQFHDYGAIEVTVLKSWKDSVRQTAGGPPTISFSPSTGREFQVLITMIKQAKEETSDLKRVRAFVERSGRELLNSSVEKKLIVEELRGPEAVGYFYFLTDKAPKSEERKYMTQGAVVLSDIMLTFTVLSNEKDGAEHLAALNMLKLARRKSPQRST